MVQASNHDGSWFLLSEEFQACQTGRRPQVRSTIRWRDYIAHLGKEHLGETGQCGQKEGKSRLLCLPCCLCEPNLDKLWKIEWISTPVRPLSALLSLNTNTRGSPAYDYRCDKQPIIAHLSQNAKFNCKQKEVCDD